MVPINAENAWANKFHLSPVRRFGKGDNTYIAVALMSTSDKPYLRLWNVSTNDTARTARTWHWRLFSRAWHDDLDVFWAERGKVWIIDDGEFVIDALTNGKIAELREELRQRYGERTP